MEKSKIQFKQEGRFFWGWYIIILNFFLMLIAYLSCVSIASIFVLPVTESLGIDRSNFVMYIMILSLVTVAISPTLGKFMRKGNMRMIMAAACISGFIGFFIMSRAVSLAMVYIAALFLGFCFSGLTSMPIAILCNNWFGGKIKGTVMGISYIGGSLGGFTLIPFVNSIITSYGWRMGYLSLGILLIVVLLPMILIIVHKKPEDKGFYRMGVKDEESTAYVENLKGMAFAQAKKTSMFYLALVSIVLTVFASSALLANNVAYFVDVGFDPARAAWMAGIMLGSMIIGKPLLGLFCDKVSVRAGAILSCWIFAAVFLFLYLMQYMPNLVWAAICCYGFAASSITLIPALMVNGLFGERDYGRLVGYFNSATSLGGAFGGTVAALVFDLTGSYLSFWLVAAIALLTAGIMRWWCFGIRARKYPDSLTM